MSRYIDADALQRALAQMWYDSQISITGISVSELIHKQPSIDIVRCGECKYWKESQYYAEVMVCTYVKGATFTRQHDDFCSRGERKDE